MKNVRLQPKFVGFTRICEAFAAAAVIAGCSAIPTSLSPIAVPLHYQSVASQGEFPSMPACAAISGIKVVDSRETNNVGKRYVETNPSVSAPVTLSSDVRSWMHSGAIASAQRAGIKEETSGPVLRLTVRQIVTSENVARRSGYEGRIVISADLMRKGGGTCWQNRFEGSSENYGYSGTAENYQETLNHALDRAMIRLFGDPGFQKSVCSCGG